MESGRRWLMLALGTAAQTVACVLVFGIPFLLPAIRREEDLSLAAAGTLAAAPSVGLMLTLVAWGALADRFGERAVLSSGMGLTAVAGAGAALASSPLALGVALAVAGAMGASTSAASGRLVMGWFSRQSRGLAMGIRQVSTPLGIGLAGLVLPPLAGAVSVGAALLAPAIGCAVMAVLVGTLAEDPPRAAAVDGERHRRPTPPLRASPYRTPVLWRVHAASALLVVPQFATATFAAEFLVGEGWDDVAAGRVLGVVALVGAAARIGAGVWSDRAGSRLRPMRTVALAAAAAMVVLGAVTPAGVAWSLPVLALAMVLTVADNGLGFTATAELAGRAWSGRALGVQNTGQNLAAFATGPLVGAVAGAQGFGVAFAACAVAPVLAAVVTPVRAEHAVPAGSTARPSPDPPPDTRAAANQVP